ncbi:MAG: hypothetical protein ACXWR1_05240 [Bdellovibrionota bacterium]
MKNLQTASLFALSLALATSCAKKHNDAPAPQPVVAVQPQLAAEYATACHSDMPNSSQIDRIQTNASILRMSTELYDGTDCSPTNLKSIQEVNSTYKIGALKRDKIFEFDIHEQRVRMEPATADIADNWNRNSYCNRNDWSAQTFQEIDKSSGCMGRNDTINQRSIYSIVMLDADKIQLGRNTTNEDDGSAPEKRHNSLRSQTYLRTGSTVLLPPEDISCPNLTGVYRCTQGDSIFAGKDAAVSSVTDTSNVTVVRIDLSQAGTQPYSEYYRPGQAESEVHAGGMVIKTRDFCEQGKLKETAVTYREGDSRNKSVVERHFSLDSRSSLVINTRNTEVANDRPNQPIEQRTECVKIQ